MKLSWLCNFQCRPDVGSIRMLVENVEGLGRLGVVSVMPSTFPATK